MQRGQARFFYILSISRSAPSLFGRLSLCLHLEVSRDSEKIYRKKNCEMVGFCTMHGKKASFLGGHELLRVHCVSKQLLILISED
jgi:hypothetical protein